MAREGASVRLGMVGPAHGVRGEVIVHPDADLAELLQPGLVCRREDGPPLEIVDVREHKQRTLVAFAGIDDRTDAEALRGAVLEVDRADVDTDEATLWVDALLGVEVVDHDGELVGMVERVDDGPAHDWLVVARPDGGELLVPLTDELVDVDQETPRIAVRALPGLLDDDWV